MCFWGDFGSGSFTLAAWIKSSTINALYSRIVSHYCGGHYGHYQLVDIHLDGKGHAEINVRDNELNQVYFAGTTNVEDGQWHYVVGVRDNDTLYLYVDSMQEGMADVSSVGDVVGPQPWTIGASKDYQGIVQTFYQGLIDDVRIYNRALSTEEIQAQMHKKPAVAEPNLVGYWDFDEGEGQVAYDMSGNGNDGQLGTSPDEDGGDPNWVNSVPPVGICTLEELVERNLNRLMDIKQDILQQLEGAVAKEKMLLRFLNTSFRDRDFGTASKSDVVKAKQKILSAMRHEQQAQNSVEKSVEKIDDALKTLDIE